MKRWITRALWLGAVAGCSSDSGSTDGAKDDEDRKLNTLRPPPSECAALPTLNEALERLSAKMDAQAGEPFELRSAYDGLTVPLSVGYLLDKASPSEPDAVGLITPPPLLIRSAEELEATGQSPSLFEVDWSQESILVSREHLREARYRYLRDGDTIVQVEAQAEPCLDAEALEVFRSAYPETRALRVPSAITQTRTVRVSERVRLHTPSDPGRCQRAEGAIIHGGGAPSLVSVEQSLRLYFNGYSAMTGNVFFGASDDGKTFTPNGWKEENLSKFEGRSLYADMYEPFVEWQSGQFRMIAAARLQDGRSHVVEVESSDGVAWGPTRELIAAADAIEDSPGGPSRVVVEGRERLYFSRLGAIWVAERDEAGAFVVRSSPALALDDRLEWADLGFGSPHVFREGDGWRMLIAGFTGGLDRRRAWRSSLGIASSSDGLSFSGAAQLLVSSGEDEANGVGSAVSHDTALLYTAINSRGEPVVKRATCSW